MFGFLLRKSGRFFVRHYYGRMQIDGAEQIPQSGPVLLCANHPNSLLDPILVGVVAQRPVRFLAKAPLFKVPVMGNVMRALGMIPAFRGRDSARDVGRNTASLDQATQILLEDGAIGIFPEGMSHDRVGVEMVRSGASRMALSAHDQGLKNLRIAPVGLNYEAKEKFDSDVWVQVGDLIELDQWLENHEGKPKQIQRQLTDEIDRRLKKCVIHLDDESWEPWLLTVEIMLNGAPIGDIDHSQAECEPMMRRKAIADRMNQFLASDAERGAELGQQIHELESELNKNGIELIEFAKMISSSGKSVFLQAFWLVLMLPIAVLGTIHHFLPFVVVRTLSKRFHSRVNRTDVSLYRLLLSIPLYTLTYVGIWFLLARSFNTLTATIWLSLAPFAGIIALEYWPAVGKFLNRWRQRRQFSRQGAEINQAKQEFHRLSQELREIASNSQSDRSWI